MRDPGRQLAKRRHLLRLDQIGLRRPQVTVGSLSRISCRADFLLGSLALGDVAEDQDDATIWHWVVANLDDSAVRARTLEIVMLPKPSP